LVAAGLLVSGGLLGLAAHGFAPLSDGIARGPVPWVVLATAGFLLAGKQIPVVDLLGRAVTVSERATLPGLKR
ncbi:acyltransferase, partial [Amycolatopsis mediterranei]